MPRFLGILLVFLACLTSLEAQDCKDSYREGDLIVRDGNGFWSSMFRNTSPREKRFSHVGIIIFEDGDPFVVHAIASEETCVGAVRKEPLESFTHGLRDWAVFRLNIDQDDARKIGIQARQLIGTPFDMDFDLEDSSAVYCTELAYLSINRGLERELIQPTLWKGRRFVYVDSCYLIDECECIDELKHHQKDLDQ